VGGVQNFDEVASWPEMLSLKLGSGPNPFSCIKLVALISTRCPPDSEVTDKKKKRRRKSGQTIEKLPEALQYIILPLMEKAWKRMTERHLYCNSTKKYSKSD